MPLFREQLLLMVASVAEDYTKRFLEYQYDALGNSDVFRVLRKMDIRKRLALEFALYLLNATVKMRAKGNTPLTAYAKGVLSDSIPEIGKRIINGDAAAESGHDTGKRVDAAVLAHLLEEAGRRLKTSFGGQN